MVVAREDSLSDMVVAREDQGRCDQEGGAIPDGHGNAATFKTYSSVTCQDEISLDETCRGKADGDTCQGYKSERGKPGPRSLSRLTE